MRLYIHFKIALCTTNDAIILHVPLIKIQKWKLRDHEEVRNLAEIIHECICIVS